ncbi:MAG: hypothetical protein JWO90_2362, partial [Solirubrobacterales bacterium]|nr:hypothetical protein [Solirubrobacterales bacterium]
MPHQRTILVLTAAAMLLGAAPAQAATAFGNPDGAFVGGDDAANRLVVTTPSGGIVRVEALAGGIDAGEGCAPSGAARVDCTVGVLALETNLLGGDDELDVQGPIRVVAFGGAGADTLRGGALGDQLL